MWKFFIFDYDGLLVNTEQVVFQAIRDVFLTYNKELTWEYYCKHIGRPEADALRDFHHDHQLPVPLDQFVEERDRAVSRRMESDLSPMKGALPLLQFLRDRGVHMAIASSGKKKHVEYGLRRFDMYDFFKTLVTIEDVARGKPHPDLVLRALKNAGCRAEDAVMFEDSPHGVKSAHRAGVFSIAVPTLGVPHKDFAQSGYVAESLAAAHEWLAIQIQ